MHAKSLNIAKEQFPNEKLILKLNKICILPEMIPAKTKLLSPVKNHN